MATGVIAALACTPGDSAALTAAASCVELELSPAVDLAAALARIDGAMGLVLVDARNGGTPNAFDVCRQLANQAPGTFVVALLADPSQASLAIEAGASDYALGLADLPARLAAVRRRLEAHEQQADTLRATAARGRAFLRALPDMAFRMDGDGVYLDVHAGREADLVAPRSALVGRKVTDVLPTPLGQEVLAAIRRVIATAQPEQFEYNLPVAPDATHFEARLVPGGADDVLCIVRNVTERLVLETQVRESRKMEAIGRLAGGVAHDFNNLLAVIYGFVAHGRKNLDPASPIRSDLDQIQQAAGRAGELTKQLLTFARRQRVEPRVFDLDQLLLGFDKLLRRVLGDDIECVTCRASAEAWVEADPGQIEQVILNLAVNARDAMPGGGILTVEISNAELDAAYCARHLEVRPGPYVLLTLSDTGAGMTPEVREHMFEPFFTTKEVGRGTGLGLATSYGIVKQAGGHIAVRSEWGKGTTFEIYLPRSSKRGASPQPATIAELPSRGETILLVEDHPTLRSISVQGLEERGYRVVSAASGEEAIKLADSLRGQVDLLLTDVVMPKMSGLQLAEKLASTCPRLKVLYVSGYTENPALLNDAPSLGVHFLAKPFTPDDLARKIREVLGLAPMPWDGPRAACAPHRPAPEHALVSNWPARRPMSRHGPHPEGLRPSTLRAPRARERHPDRSYATT
jgi:signal transduction histidine kinase/ActR/RegA family two-component response regulator